MTEFKKHYHEFHERNTEIYALSVDSPEKSSAMKKDMQLPFELLCDVDKKVIALYDLLNPYEHGGIAYPAVFIINADGIICFRSLDRTAKRVDISITLEFIKKLNENPQYIADHKSQKEWIVPSPVNSLKAARNLIFTSSLKDWKDFILSPFKILKFTGKKKKK